MCSVNEAFVNTFLIMFRFTVTVYFNMCPLFCVGETCQGFLNGDNFPNPIVSLKQEAITDCFYLFVFYARNIAQIVKDMQYASKLVLII